MSFVKNSQHFYSGWLISFLTLSAIGCQHSQRSVLVTPAVQTAPRIVKNHDVNIETFAHDSTPKATVDAERIPTSESVEESTAQAQTEDEEDLQALEILQIAQSGSVDDLLLAVQAQVATESLLKESSKIGSRGLPTISSDNEPLIIAQGPESHASLASTRRYGKGIDDADRKIESALLAAYSIDDAGRSVGLPHQGTLESGVPLPKMANLYTIRSRRSSYGSSHTVLQIVTAFETFRKRSSYTGKIVIADMSRKDGGKIRHHASHQIGRDIDILMPVLDDSKAWGNNVDWLTTWKLVRAFLDTGEVEYIFLDYELQEPLHHAATELGESPTDLKKWISWPRGLRYPAIVRDSPGHTAHIHVRIHCGPLEPKCRSRGRNRALQMGTASES